MNKYLEQVQGYSFKTCLELDVAISLLGNKPAAVATASATDEAVKNHLAQQQDSSKDLGPDVTATGTATAPSTTATLEEDEDEDIDVEQVVLDEIGGLLWRMLYLRRNEIEVDHVLELSK